MRCVVLGMRNAVRCEIWCYGDMVIWPALQVGGGKGHHSSCNTLDKVHNLGKALN